MRLIHSILLLTFTFFSISAQVDVAGYDFKLEESLSCTPVKSQNKTGTCWSFSTVSFLESELLRQGKELFDLSEMYIVRNIYKDKARNYILRQGKANFSQGSLSHDVMRAFKMGGIVPEEIYSGKISGETIHDHGEMEAALQGMLNGLLKRKKQGLSSKWPSAVDCLLDVYIGAAPKQFTYNGKSYTVESFTEELGLNPDDYVNLTSFTHHPFYEKMILEVPDNYSNGAYFNLPLNELEAIVDNSLRNGYTIAWDGDVSETGFNAKEGIAILPDVARKPEEMFKSPGKEMAVTQQIRQRQFESYATTDDHLMHITGLATDQMGTKYYLVKNSWGEISPYKGYLYMSAPYFQLKTVGVMVHKDAIPKDIATRLSL